MKAIYARKPSKEERQKLESGLKSSVGATVRRSQIILMSAEERKTAREISERIGQSDQQVRKMLHAFNENGAQKQASAEMAPILQSGRQTNWTTSLADFFVAQEKSLAEPD